MDESQLKNVSLVRARKPRAASIEYALCAQPQANYGNGKTGQGDIVETTRGVAAKRTTAPSFFHFNERDREEADICAFVSIITTTLEHFSPGDAATPYCIT